MNPYRFQTNTSNQNDFYILNEVPHLTDDDAIGFIKRLSFTVEENHVIYHRSIVHPTIYDRWSRGIDAEQSPISVRILNHAKHLANKFILANQAYADARYKPTIEFIAITLAVNVDSMVDGAYKNESFISLLSSITNISLESIRPHMVAGLQASFLKGIDWNLELTGQ